MESRRLIGNVNVIHAPVPAHGSDYYYVDYDLDVGCNDDDDEKGDRPNDVDKNNSNWKGHVERDSSVSAMPTEQVVWEGD